MEKGLGGTWTIQQMNRHFISFWLFHFYPIYFSLAICGGRVSLAGRHFHAEIRRAAVRVVGFGEYKIAHVSEPIMSRMDMFVVFCPKWRNLISVSTFTTQTSLGGLAVLSRLPKRVHVSEIR